MKTSKESIHYTVDLLYTAINEKKQIAFKYYKYTPEKKKTFKHGGQVYLFSPYDLVWSNVSYYVFGYSENHGKAVKFRVDRMRKSSLSGQTSRERPDNHDITEFQRKVL